MPEMICNVCRKNPAQWDEYYGWLPCKECQDRQAGLSKPTTQIEFTSDSIKEGRRAYANDIEPDHIKGHLNKKWVDIYGKDAAKKRGFTDKEIKEAKYVANDIRYYKDEN